MLQIEIIVGHRCHTQSWHFSSDFLNVFHDYSHLNKCNQLVVGIVLSCCWLKNYKNLFLHYSMTIRQYVCGKESTKQRKMAWTHSNAVCMTLRYHNKLVKVDIQTVFSGFICVCLTQIMELADKQEYKMFGTGDLVRKSLSMRPY